MKEFYSSPLTIACGFPAFPDLKIIRDLSLGLLNYESSILIILNKDISEETKKTMYQLHIQRNN